MSTLMSSNDSKRRWQRSETPDGMRPCFQCGAGLNSIGKNFCDTVCRNAYNLFSWGNGRPVSGLTDYMQKMTKAVAEAKARRYGNT